MARPKKIRVRAHAKINLMLHVHGRRADGYHELETVFQSLALHDVLTCELRPGPFSIECDEAGVPVDERNLIWRAAQRLWEALGRRGPVQGAGIALSKQIPMQAGLGGGSADAAAALRALACLWEARDRVDLTDVASKVGADVPYFLVGGTALGVSRGDRLYPLPDIPPYFVVLGLPAFGVSTAEAYGWFDREGAALAAAGVRDAGQIPAWSGRPLRIVNALQAPVVARHPEIGALRDRLAAMGAAAALMTGSGSAVFGLFQRQDGARRAAGELAGMGVIALVTRTADRRACLREPRAVGR